MTPQDLKYSIDVDVIFHKPLGDIMTNPPVSFRSDGLTILDKYDVEGPTILDNYDVKAYPILFISGDWRFEKWLELDLN